MIDAVTSAKWLKRFLAMTPEQAEEAYWAYQGGYDDAVYATLLKSMDLRKIIRLDGI